MLHVSQPTEAGVAAVVESLVADQTRRGWDVTVACPPGNLSRAAKDMGARAVPWRAGRAPGAGVALSTGELASIVRRTDPDVCHLHSSMAGLTGRLAIRGRRPTIFQPHAWSFEAARGALGRVSTAWEGLASRWTDEVVCASEGEAAAGRAAGVTVPIRLVPNGVDVDRFDPSRWPERAGVRRRLDLPARPVVLCAGRLCEQKGQDLLFEAWPTIASAVPDAVLVIVGDGPMREEVRDTAARSTSVQWAGAVDDLAPWYLAADVVVVPSRWEGMALVPLEALACARPVVAFDVAGVRESVGDAGAVVAARDHAELARAVTERLLDLDLAADEGQRGRERAVRMFDARQAADRVAHIAEDLLGRTADRAPIRRTESG